MTRHHWQCEWNCDQVASECNCGLTGPRVWWMNLLPPDRPPTEEEVKAWREAIAAVLTKATP